MGAVSGSAGHGSPDSILTARAHLYSARLDGPLHLATKEEFKTSNAIGNTRTEWTPHAANGIRTTMCAKLLRPTRASSKETYE